MVQWLSSLSVTCIANTVSKEKSYSQKFLVFFDYFLRKCPCSKSKHVSECEPRLSPLWVGFQLMADCRIY